MVCSSQKECVCAYTGMYTETKSSQFCYWLTGGASERPDDFIRVRRLLRYPRIRSGHQSAPHDATLTSSLQHEGAVPLYFLDPERTSPTLPTAPSVFLDLLPHPTSGPHKPLTQWEKPQTLRSNRIEQTAVRGRAPLWNVPADQTRCCIPKRPEQKKKAVPASAEQQSAPSAGHR